MSSFIEGLVPEWYQVRHSTNAGLELIAPLLSENMFGAKDTEQFLPAASLAWRRRQRARQLESSNNLDVRSVDPTGGSFRRGNLQPLAVDLEYVE